MTTANEMQGQAQKMAESMAQHGAEYHVGECHEMDWREANGHQYRGTVEITPELLRRAEQELSVLRDHCPICGDPLPVQRDRRVTCSGLVVCDRATCEAQADG